MVCLSNETIKNAYTVPFMLYTCEEETWNHKNVCALQFIAIILCYFMSTKFSVKLHCSYM